MRQDANRQVLERVALVAENSFGLRHKIRGQQSLFIQLPLFQELGFEQAAFATLGEALLLEQRKLYEQGLLSPYFVAQTEAVLGNQRDALKYLTIGILSHDEFMLTLGVDHGFASLECEPAFQKRLAKIVLPTAH